MAASPVARRMAVELGVDLRRLTGTGVQGRVTKADVESAAAGAAGGAPTKATASPSAPAGQGSSPVANAKGDVTLQELSRVQQVVVRRMSESKATVPEFTVSMDVDMEAAIALSGQVAGRIDEVKPVAQIIAETVAEFEAVTAELGRKYGTAGVPA